MEIVINTWPKIVVAVWLIARLCYAAHQHGKKPTQPVNFWAAVVFVCLVILVLSFGGFWEPEYRT